MECTCLLQRPRQVTQKWRVINWGGSTGIEENAHYQRDFRIWFLRQPIGRLTQLHHNLDHPGCRSACSLYFAYATSRRCSTATTNTLTLNGQLPLLRTGTDLAVDIEGKHIVRAVVRVLHGSGSYALPLVHHLNRLSIRWWVVSYCRIGQWRWSGQTCDTIPKYVQ